MEKLLIQVGQLTPDTKLLRQHLDYWEAYLPFDDLVIPVNAEKRSGRYGPFIPDGLPDEWSLPEAVFHNRKIDFADYEHVINDLKNTPFKQFKHNFLPISFYYPQKNFFDWTHQDWWINVLHNIEIIAGIAYRSGCVGLFFDTEQYSGDCTFQYYRRGLPDTDEGFNEYAKVVKEKGNAFMSTINNAFPECQLLLSFGTSQAYLDTIEETLLCKKIRPRYTIRGLLAPFVDGLLEATSSSLEKRITDGCEYCYCRHTPSGRYPYKLLEDFAYAWQVVHNCSVLLSTLSNDVYSSRILAGNAIFGLESNARHMTATEMQIAVNAALQNTDRYTWLWNEKKNYWVRPNTLPLLADQAHFSWWESGSGLPPASVNNVMPKDWYQLKSEERYVEKTYIDAITNGKKLVATNLTIRPFDGKEFGSVSPPLSMSDGDSFRGWSWDGATASYITVDEDHKSWLTIRPFNGEQFGQVSTSLSMSGGDSFRGWSWDGNKTASYIVFGNQGSSLIIRTFDGEFPYSNEDLHLDPKYKMIPSMSGGDSFRGWSWNGATASYITVDEDHKSWLTIRPFNGEQFGQVSTSLSMSGGDVFRGWSWNGATASYIVAQKG